MHLVETGGEDRRAVPAVEEEAAIMQVLMTLIFHHTLHELWLALLWKMPFLRNNNKIKDIRAMACFLFLTVERLTIQIPMTILPF